MKTKNLLLIVLTFLAHFYANAQILQAENATLTGNASTLSGGTGQVVNLQEGGVSFSFNAPSTGFYDIYINAAAPYGEKNNNIVVDGLSSSFYLPANNSYVHLKSIVSISLSEGNHTIEITASWGWINIDYIELVEVDASDRFNITTELVTPNPSNEAKSLYQFLYDNYGEKIISGVMTLNSFDESDWLLQQTGKEPALLGIDIMHNNRNYTWYDEMTPVNDAITWYRKNGIPIICWHWRDPMRQTEGFYAPHVQNNQPKTDFDITKIFEPSSPEYAAMISDIDYTAELFKNLQNANVPILWRPIHEAAGGWFWWGTGGPEACKELYHIMFDRMVNYHGLNNLIWVWTSQPGDADWYPGDEYVDIVGRDIYQDGDHQSHVLQFNSMNEEYAGTKMITLSEVGSFPDVDNLINDGAAWSWYMPWYGDFTRDAFYNSLDLWKKMFASDYVITLDEMPELSTYGDVVTSLNLGQSSQFEIRPTLVSDNIRITSSEEEIKTVKIFTSTGTAIITTEGKGKEMTLDVNKLPSGTYLVLVNNHKSIKIYKK